MASKINSRLKSDKARSGKPYDRPKQSLLRKVASAVKNVLVPSWFLNVPSWGNSSEEETVPAPESVEPEDQDEVTEPVNETCTAKPAKRLRYAPDNSEVTDVARPRQETLFPPSIVNESLSARVEHETPQVTQNCELEKKEPQLIVNGDDHSENSEGTASTSGCSSLVSSHVDKQDHHFSSIKLSENALENLRKELKGKSFLRQKKDAAVSTENSFSSPCSRNGSQADLSLWARNSSFSVRNTSRPQATFQGSRPSFNLSSFGGPSVASSPLSAKEKVSSPFYEGKTTYGGASAYRRAQLSSLPYQSSRILQNKITVKPSNAGENFQCMSSAAKRILNTLEKMSTPLTDVKKIPNVRQSPADISASFTPASQRLNSRTPTPRRPVSASPYTKGLPASSISTASRLNLMKNFSKISKNSKMEIPVHERSTLSLNYPTQSAVSDNETSKGGGGGGKIRTKINQHLHQSSKTNEAIEMPTEVHLPNIPLPITDLPEIKFTDTEKPKISVPKEKCKTPSTKEPVTFTFADPLDKSPPSVAVQPQQTFSGPAFTFSSPIVANETRTTSVSPKVTADKDKAENNVDKQKESELYTGSVNDFLRTLRDSNQKSVGKNSSEKENKTYSNTYKASKELLEPADSGFGDKFKPQTGTWECSSCLVRNESTTDKCVCCSVSKSKPQESADKQQLNSSFGFGEKFKPPPGSWECTSCLVRNKAGDKKCASCESENPNISKDSGQDIKFGSNISKVEKPDSNKVQNETFSGFKFSTAGTWECDACLVRNPVGKSRCVACETPKLDPKSSSAGSKSNFSAPTGSTGFRFGSLVANPVPAAGSSPFLRAVSLETSKPQSSVTFGSTTLPVTTEGFKFNPPTPVTSAESGGFKFGVPVSDASLKPSEGLFKIESPASKTDKNFISDNSSTSAPCLTFGNLNPTHKDTYDHSKTVTTEISEETEHKTEIETVPKSDILASVAPTVQLLPKPSPQFPSNTSSITSISNTQCSSNTITTAVTTTTNTTTTTTASSGIISSGFVFGSNNLQSQSATTFPFGNKTDDVKTSSCAVSSAQTTTVFTSTAASSSVSLPSPFIFSSEPSKQFASSETAPVKIPADNSHGMTQETPVELQSAAEVNSTNSLSFSSSTSSQPTNFVFGTSNAPAAASSRSSLFKFSGTAASSTAESTPKSSGIFTFGVPATTEIKDTKPAFPFAAATSEEKPQTLPQPQFTFSAFKPDSSNSVVTSTSAAVTSSPFRFGATTTPAPSTGGFVFGTPKPDVSQTASSPFTFGTGVAAKPLSNSNFGAFSQNQPVTTASVPSFNFGMTTTNPAPVGGGFSVPSSNPSNLFTFGAKTSQSTPNPVNNTGAIANPGSVFGSPASQSVFSNSTPIPSFGKQPEQKQETPSGFSFGGSTSSQTPVFRFGSNVPDGPLEKRRAAAPVPSGGGFNFAVPQPNAMNNNTMSFNPTTPPTFNFGAMPAGAPLFQFNANTESTSAPNTGARKYRKAVRRNVRKPE